MHLLVVTVSFPSPDDPYSGSFIGEQVRLLCEREQIQRVTVLSPTAFVPPFMRRFRRVARQASLPDCYQMIEGRCEVRFPRYPKAPGALFLRWTVAQWRRIVDQTVARFVRTAPVSLIHANYAGVSSWAAICTAKRYHIPCVVTYQGSEVHTTLANQYKGWRLCRDSFRWADLNLPVSRSLEGLLRRFTEPTGRCEVLLRGVDQTRFFPASRLTSEPHVLFVGRISEAKGALDLVSAWAEVKKAYPAALLTVVGHDHTNGLFVRQARSLGVDSSITLTGPLPSPQVAELMRRSRIFCLPSHQEGTPNCVMEALSCGLPIVATRVGGVPDIVQHEKTGLLVETGDVGGLATALVALLQDFRLCTRMGQNAYAFARAHLDARRTVGRLVELYSELIAARPRQSFMNTVSRGALPGSLALS